MDDQEYLVITQKAEQLKMSNPAFLRHAAIKTKIRTPLIDREGALQISRQLGAIGNNLNQLTKRANQGGDIDKTELEEMRKELNAIWQQLNLLLQKT